MRDNGKQMTAAQLQTSIAESGTEGAPALIHPRSDANGGAGTRTGIDAVAIGYVAGAMRRQSDARAARHPFRLSRANDNASTTILDAVLGREFESLRARQSFQFFTRILPSPFSFRLHVRLHNRPLVKVQAFL